MPTTAHERAVAVTGAPEYEHRSGDRGSACSEPFGRCSSSRFPDHRGPDAERLPRLDQVAAPKLRESLGASAERLALNEEFARLCSDVPLRALFQELEFKSLLARLERLQIAPE
jgi:hypothetical protein